MSSVATTPIATPATHPFYFILKRLHSFAGIMFGSYICVHLLINATMIQGRTHDVFQHQVNTIHGLPFLELIEWSAIFLPLIVHTIYGFYIIANGKPNVGSYSYLKNWFFVMQRITALILVLFIAFHVLSLKYGLFGQTLAFDPEKAFETTIRHVHASPLLYLLVYPLGILAGTFHLANGFWTAGIAWGLTVSKASQTRWGWICLGLFAFTTACGFTALIATFIHQNA